MTVLPALQGLPPAQIAILLEQDSASRRRWIIRFTTEGAAGG
ncbi:hypothetical protein ABZ721_14585 [Streptomyces sp. NPDC006733]